MTTVTPYRSTERDTRNGFGQLLHAEWTKFRTVRGWVIGLIVAILVTAGLGVLIAKTAVPSCSAQISAGPHTPVQHGPVQHGAACGQPIYAKGPGGTLVQDEFYFVRQPLAGDGSITVRVTSLTGLGREEVNGRLAGRLFVPWSKAGIIIKDGTGPGSAYAAMMATGGNGVRMQWNYTQDTPGLPGAVSAAGPRWLRLTRAGDTITGYDSADGTHWARVGTVTLAGLRSTVQAGLFVTSPRLLTYSSSLGVGNASNNPTEATAVFDHVSRTGTWPARGWTGDDIGAGDNNVVGQAPGYHQAAGRFTVTGSGDIAPLIAGATNDGPNITVRDYLLGTFAGLIAVAVVAAMFMTAEYRRGLIRTTLAASPHRGRVLAAKAIVIGAAAFVAGLAAAAGAVLIASDIAHRNGAPVFPEPWPTELRIIAGTAALIALAAVFTLAVATIVRRSATAILIVIVTLVIPFVLSAPPGIPVGLTDWLLRVTPAAAFALQQPAPQYYQVQANYIPSAGYFPLAPWTGFAVLCAWTVIALAAAGYLLRRRDA
ncbi:MAG TPA: ABC transporter permease subunit [Streptosporangiaceae bacterium]|jgi:ABC-type transport system involved in multi-copper enzyme maturation permease subunit